MDSSVSPEASSELTIGLYIGLADDQTDNVATVLGSWGQLLKDTAWSIETYGSAVPPDSTPSNITHIDTTTHSYRTPFDKIVSVYRESREYIKRRSPDVVIQFWQTQTNAPGVVLAGKQSGTPVVTRFVGDIFKEYTDFNGISRAGVYLLGNVICAKALKSADRVIAFGPYGEAELSRIGIADDAIEILPPSFGIEDRFQPSNDVSSIRDRLGLPPDRPIALYTGRLTGHKGMEFMMNVIDQTIAESNVLFVLVGAGPYRSRLEGRFSRTDVRLPGYVDHHRIHKYYQAADVYVHPSQFEGVPLSTLEALNCDVPVIAREAGDISLITPHVIHSPNEMAALLSDRNWQHEIDIDFRFQPTYQKQTLQKLIGKITT